MTASPHIAPAGVILAGGRSSRMGGMSKALFRLNDEALLTHVIRRLQPQLSSLLLSTEGPDTSLKSFGFPLVPDLLPRYRGPLTGLCSALHYLADKGWDGGLVLCPCDAPFIPPGLVERLVSAAVGSPKPVAVVSYEGFLQPTFSLWQAHHFPVIYDAVVKRGDGGLKYMLQSLPHVIVEWVSAEPPPFYNVNTPEELQTAERWLAAPRNQSQDKGKNCAPGS
jgi:molybdopterin-guanine dinucleotide biosynthesis protein A